MVGVQASVVARVLTRMREVFGREAEAAATAIDAALQRAPVRVVPALDRAVRDPDAQGEGGFFEVRAGQVAALERLGERASAVLGVVSLVRDGHTRQAAVEALAGRLDRLATAFLINRVNDYVRPVADRAWLALEPRMTAEHAALLVACLPLIDRMRGWTRADRAAERLLGFLRGPHPVVRAALWAGLAARDGEVVAAAASLLAQVHRGEAEIEPVLAAALAVRDPRVRRWAALVAADADWTPAATFLALAPQLAVDRTPAIRARAVAGLTRLGDRAAVARAALDTNAEVRHQARVALAEVFEAPLDYRGEALRMLSEGTDRRQTLAALALLSEFGRAEDRAVVLRAAADPRPAVAREARRTLTRLP